jgi:hypothetical protein
VMSWFARLGTMPGPDRSCRAGYVGLMTLVGRGFVALGILPDQI